jgi:cytochrome c peroxidase
MPEREIVRHTTRCFVVAGLAIGVGLAQYKVPSSYLPVDMHESFAALMARMSAAKPEIMKRQMELLEERYDLSDRPAPGVTMSRGKPVQQGVRVKLPAGVTWEQLAKTPPDQIKSRNLYPIGFLALPQPNHPEGGMLFPKFEGVCLLYDDGPTPRPIEPLLIFTDVEVPVGIEVAAQV